VQLKVSPKQQSWAPFSAAIVTLLATFWNIWNLESEGLV